jgi:hypothetical protein
MKTKTRKPRLETKTLGDAPTALPADAQATLFAGYDSVVGEFRSQAVMGGTKSTGGVASQASVKVAVCRNMEQLASALCIDQSLSVSYLGIASMNEKMQFVRNLNITSESILIVVYARHELGTTTALNPTFEVPPPQQQGLLAFVEGYGDAYVKSITGGGEYYAVYVFYTETSTEQQSLDVSMKASGIFSGVTASADLGVKIDNFVQTTSTNWRFDQQVSGIASPVLPTMDQMIEYAINFPSLQLDSPVVIEFSTAGYEHVPGCTGFEQIVTNRNYFVGAGSAGGLAGSLVEIASLQNKTAWIRQIYSCYGYTGDAELQSFAASLDADETTIRNQFEAYEADPTQIFTKPALPSLGQGTPTISYNHGTSDAWGGPGGSPFDFGDIYQAITNQQTIHSIQLGPTADDSIDWLLLVYSDIHGAQAAQGYGPNDHGTPTNTLTMNPNEWPQQFQSSHGGSNADILDFLAFTTNQGGSLSAGDLFGKEPFPWSIPDGSFFLGFSGAAGDWIDRLQVVYASFNPATFSPDVGRTRYPLSPDN